MKTLTLSLALLMAFNVEAKKSDAKICESLYKTALDSCAVNICEDYVNATEEECVFDGDFHVAAQECAYEELPALVKNYNAKNPTKKISCEE